MQAGLRRHAGASGEVSIAFVGQYPFSTNEEISRSNVWRLISCSIRRQPVEAGTARRQRRPIIRKEACGFEDFEAFNLWASIVVDRRGGSNRLSARPTGSKWKRALPAGSGLWGSLPESSDREASQGSNLWPRDARGRR